MSGTVVTRLTFEEFARLPEYTGRQELLRGEVIEMPPAKLPHNLAAHRTFYSLLAIITAAHAKGNLSHLGEIYLAMGYRFEDDGWLIPDVSATHHSQRNDGDYYIDSPALVIEVISNEKTADYIESKIDVYLSHGALEVWVMYRSRGHMWVYRPDGTAVLYSGVIQSGLLDGATIDLHELLL